eukprot:TRINITY_DN21727_c0_g1_i1.p1 TRINITY_DN21727_c0_g1~~TRINITY_DN21727_c0_g1_i1.p1  ORF type:complete len:338 (+),score=93.06 TRINITY_DN21727_c0_g1_i1:77-1090(+)
MAAAAVLEREGCAAEVTQRMEEMPRGLTTIRENEALDDSSSSASSSRSRSTLGRQTLVQQLSSEVTRRLEADTAQKMAYMWGKGLETMQKMQAEHREEVQAVRSQLQQYTEATDQLREENRQMQAHMQHLLGYLGAMMQAQAAQAHAQAQTQLSAGGATPQLPLPAGACGRPQQPIPRYPPGLHLPADVTALLRPPRTPSPASPVLANAAENEAAKNSPKTPPSECSTAASAAVTCFNLTLRRVEGKPMGIIAKPDTTQQCLIVGGVQKGSVAFSWNNQNEGQLREIRKGDRIVVVNGQNECEAMRHEFKHNLLLRMNFERPADDDAASSDGASSSM